MTLNEIDALCAGRDMDFLVAEAMGFKLEVRQQVWEREDYPSSDNPQLNQISIPIVTNPMHGIHVPNYSTDKSLWFEIVDFLTSKKIGVNFDSSLNMVMLESNGSYILHTKSFGNTPCIAICRALLKFHFNED